MFGFISRQRLRDIALVEMEGILAPIVARNEALRLADLQHRESLRFLNRAHVRTLRQLGKARAEAKLLREENERMRAFPGRCLLSGTAATAPNLGSDSDDDAASPSQPRHWAWANLMRRAFDLDVLACLGKDPDPRGRR